MRARVPSRAPSAGAASVTGRTGSGHGAHLSRPGGRAGHGRASAPSCPWHRVSLASAGARPRVTHSWRSDARADRPTVDAVEPPPAAEEELVEESLVEEVSIDGMCGVY